MNKQASRSASEIITLFTQQKQEMELHVAKKQFDALNDELKRRREQLLGGKKKEAKVDASKAEKFKTMDEHKITLEELEVKIQTSVVNGLTTSEAQARLIRNGPNMLSEKKAVPWFVKLFHELTSVFAMMMWVGSLLCFIVFGITPDDPSNVYSQQYQKLYLGLVLAIVVTLTGILAYFQNEKSEAMMEAFKNFIPPETQVIRDGKQQKLAAKELVIGDVVIVELGKRIPADIRILESNGMKVDNSSLTGESLLLLRTNQCTHPDNPLETKNLAFFGTLNKEGTGKGVVIFTGDNTVIGQIAGLAASSDSEESPLRQEINHFIKLIATIAFIVGIAFLIFGLTTGYEVLTSILFCIGIIVGYVPEGLLATVTIALSLTARRLAQQKVLVKNLEGVETLGSTSCICSDKTGTLTQNKMTVENLWYNGVRCKGHNRQKNGPKFKYEYDIGEKGFQDLAECAALCSEAVFDSTLPQEKIIKVNSDAGLSEAQKTAKIQKLTEEWAQNLEKLPWLERPTIGDASETALIKFLQPIQDVMYTRSLRKLASDATGKLARMPFNSTNKYAFIIVEYETDESHYCLFTKGAPERIWGLCDTIQIRGNQEIKDQRWEDAFNQINSFCGKNGERVLGFAKLHLPKSQFPKNFQFNLDKFNFPFEKQSFVGTMSLVDPPKDAVPDAVIKCKTAGIKVIMVTGDQPVTAAAIAKQCNIITEMSVNEIAEKEGITFEEAFYRSNAIVIHGDRLTKMAIDDEGKPEAEKGRLLSEWLDKSQIVFARTSPAQKLIIVDGCQKKGHIVAVTGDGVNDSPAIKKADIGISMGISGSDVAKDAADMILLNDDFSNIVIGIEEGRKIFDNLKKTITFVLCGNISEVIPFLAMVAVQIPLPLTTILILFIDLGTALMPSTAFVYEDAEIDVMTRRPRNKNEHMVTPKLIFFSYCLQGYIQCLGAFLCYFIVMTDYGFTVSGLIGLQTKTGYKPNDNDVFDSTDIFLGNTMLRDLYIKNVADNKDYDVCSDYLQSSSGSIDFLYSKDAKVDLRMTFMNCDKELQRWNMGILWDECKIDLISPITNRPVCYTTEAITHSQIGYYYGVVFTQAANYFALKTHKSSIFFQGYRNPMMFFGFFTQLLVMFCLAYIQVLNVGLQSRDVVFEHFGFPSVPFCMLMILYNEVRKWFVRNIPPTGEIPNWWQRCTVF